MELFEWPLRYDLSKYDASVSVYLLRPPIPFAAFL